MDLLKSFPILGQVNINSFTQLFEPWSPVIESELLPKHPFYLFKEVIQGFQILKGLATSLSDRVFVTSMNIGDVETMSTKLVTLRISLSTSVRFGLQCQIMIVTATAAAFYLDIFELSF